MAVMLSPFYPLSKKSTSSNKRSSASWLVLFICSFLSASAWASESQGAPAMPVNVISAAVQDVPVSYTYPGRTQAAKQAEVHARVSGILQKKFYEDGDKVKAGQLLYKIDDRRYRAAVNQAKAQVEMEQANLNQAQREYKRVSSLSRGKAVSEQDVDKALANYELARASLSGAQAALDNALIDLDYTEVRAEIDGVTGIKHQDVGNLVGSDAQNTLLTTVTQLDPMHVIYALPDSERKRQQAMVAEGKLKLIQTGHWKAEIIDEAEQIVAAGQVDFIDSRIDPNTGSVQARAVFENSDRLLLPGEFVRLRISGAERLNVFIVPQKAVLQMGQQSFVYVVKEGKAVLIPIKLAAPQGGNWLVESGLNDGDQVVISNLIKLRPNSPVQVIPAQAGQASSQPNS